MYRLLEKHLYDIDAFIVDCSAITFAKTNASLLLKHPDAFNTSFNTIDCWINNLMPSFHLLQIWPQLRSLRQMDRRLDKHSDAFNTFIE